MRTSNAAAAANVLRYQLIAAGQQYPGSDEPGVLLRFGRGRLPRTTGRVRSDPGLGRRRGGVRLWRGPKRGRVCVESPSNSACPTSIETAADPSPRPLPDGGAVDSPPPMRRRHRAPPTARSCTGCSPCWPRCCCCSSCSPASAMSVARDRPDGTCRCDGCPQTVPVAAASTAGAVLSARDARRAARRREDDFGCRCGQLGGVELLPTATPTRWAGHVDAECAERDRAGEGTVCGGRAGGSAGAARRGRCEVLGGAVAHRRRSSPAPFW